MGLNCSCSACDCHKEYQRPNDAIDTDIDTTIVNDSTTLLMTQRQKQSIAISSKNKNNTTMKPQHKHKHQHSNLLHQHDLLRWNSQSLWTEKSVSTLEHSYNDTMTLLKNINALKDKQMKNGHLSKS